MWMIWRLTSISEHSNRKQIDKIKHAKWCLWQIDHFRVECSILIAVELDVRAGCAAGCSAGTPKLKPQSLHPTEKMQKRIWRKNVFFLKTRLDEEKGKLQNSISWDNGFISFLSSFYTQANATFSMCEASLSIRRQICHGMEFRMASHARENGAYLQGGAS